MKTKGAPICFSSNVHDYCIALYFRNNALLNTNNTITGLFVGISFYFLTIGVYGRSITVENVSVTIIHIGIFNAYKKYFLIGIRHQAHR